LAVTFGVARAAEGRGYATGFEVTYETDGHLRHQSFKTGIAVCSKRGYVRGVTQMRCQLVPDQLR
jgi:hypothetical protein